MYSQLQSYKYLVNSKIILTLTQVVLLKKTEEVSMQCNGCIVVYSSLLDGLYLLSPAYLIYNDFAVF